MFVLLDLIFCVHWPQQHFLEMKIGLTRLLQQSLMMTLSLMAIVLVGKAVNRSRVGQQSHHILQHANMRHFFLCSYYSFRKSAHLIPFLVAPAKFVNNNNFPVCNILNLSNNPVFPLFQLTRSDYWRSCTFFA